MATEIPSFLITFREALEAALIVAILIAYLKKIQRPALSRYVWLGAISAMLLSVGVGGAILAVFGELSGVSMKLFEGFASLTATGVLTYMIFWMARNSVRIKSELEHRVDISITRGQLLGIAGLAFIAVLREGIETVLFLTALTLQNPASTLVGFTGGLAVVGGLALLMLRGTLRLPLKSFFKYTSILLLVFSAGLAGYGVHELVGAARDSGVQLGLLAQPAFDVNPMNKADPLHENGFVGSILKALVGYDGNPEWLRVFVYLGYWLLTGSYVAGVYAPGSRLNLYQYVKSPRDSSAERQV